MERPSKTKRLFWLMAHPKGKVKLSVKSKLDCKAGIGTWLIFESRKNIDQAWEKIKDATESGHLTDIGAKVSTRRKKPVEFSGGTNDHVICVYTKDTEDHKDAVRDALYNLGFVRYLPYKTVAATDADSSLPHASTSRKRPHPSPSSSGSNLKRISLMDQPEFIPGYLAPQIWPPSTGDPIEFYTTDNSRYRYGHGQKYIHVQQMYPTPGDHTPDVLFPIEQIGQVCQAFYTLCNTIPTPEGSDDKIVVLDEGYLTVKIWGERVSQFDGKFAIVMQHKRTKKKVQFLQSP
ncbi:uncharacterized protein LOC118434148 [Folsomia candida]|uniref:uncharacterized protein LOC118434148 n=1 Tax=Folsomia candida TaxID=158441 RepID=UPI001604B129|nr:uncharacterized protein LOC118434148 [Folsomia candida]